jgi:OmpA-OmpF porin, OOP family
MQPWRITKFQQCKQMCLNATSFQNKIDNPPMSRRQFSHLALCFSLTANAVIAFAQTNNIRAASPDSAYAQDSGGNVVRSEFGLCWRTGAWTDSNAIAGCDGQLAPPVLKATAPEMPGIASPILVPAAVAADAASCNAPVTLSNEQTFEFNKAELTAIAKQRIKTEVIEALDACSRVNVILVTGHADRLGSAVYNKKLSERRADSVAVYLRSQGVTVPVQGSGVGSAQPVKTCSNKLTHRKLIDCLAPNRRVTIVAQSPAKSAP